MRKIELDLIRVLALLLVILQHSCSMLEVSGPVFNCLWMGVPLFVMLSGSLQFKPSYSGASVLNYYSRRYARILPPFLVWGLIVYVISALMHKYNQVQTAGDAFRHFIPFLVTNRINEAFWYVYLIAALYLVTPLLKVIFAGRSGTRILTCCIAVWLVAAVLRDFFPSLPVFSALPVTGRFAGYWLGFYLCGHYLMNIARRKPGPGCAAAVFALALAASIVLSSRGIASLSLQILQAVSLFSALTELRVSPSNLLTDMSRYSYTAYLTHFMIIGLLYTALPAVFPQRWYTPLYTAPVVLAAEFVFCRALDSIKRLPGWLTGIARR